MVQNGGEQFVRSVGRDPGGASAGAVEEAVVGAGHLLRMREAMLGDHGSSDPARFAHRSDLAPNTEYVVDGRGRFFTNEHGDVVYVEARQGPVTNGIRIWSGRYRTPPTWSTPCWASTG